MKYFSTQRALIPGGFPKPEGNKVIDIHNFDNREYVKEIGKMAWGWIEYEHRLSRSDMKNYELVPLSKRKLHFTYLGKDSWGRYVYKDEKGKVWKLLDCCSPREVCEKRQDTPYSSCGNKFDGEPNCPMANDIMPIFETEENKHT